MAENSGKKSRKAFTTADRKLICDLKNENQTWTNVQVADEAGRLLERKVDKTSVSRILKGSQLWLTATSDVTKQRARKPKWEEMEADLIRFYNQARLSQ